MVFQFAAAPAAIPALITLALGGCLYQALKASPTLPLDMYSTIDDASATPGHGAIYTYRGEPVTLEKLTLLDQLLKAVDAFPNQPFLGRRPVDADGVAGPFTWQTYAECYKRIQCIASGLVVHKMLEPTDDGHKFLGIYMKNRPEWVLSQYAAYHAGAAVVPIYDTLGVTSTEFILNQTGVTTVVCTSAELEGLLAKAKSVTSLRHIILADVTTIEAYLVVRAGALDVRLWTLAEVEAAGAVSLVPAVPISPSSMALLMYTSGTTGDPKGAMLSHTNLVTVRQGTFARLEFGRVGRMLKSHPSVLSYLPLAHIAEQNLQASMIHAAGAIGFYQGDPLKILDDLQALRPTIFASVPRLLNRIYEKVMEAAMGAGGIKAWLFVTALHAKVANLERGYASHAFYDRLVFGKLKAKLGLDRCELFFAGAAPLAPPVLSFYRVLLNCMCLEMYGQTEVSGSSTMTDHRECDAGTVGPPLVTSQVKLVSVPDMGYLVDDTKHGDDDQAMIVCGRGEVCVRGPAVFGGYYKDAARTAEALDADGWLHSGDIGVWTTDGRLKIVDRKKNIFKLAQGEYVAPEKIENVLQASPYVAQVFVYGDSLHASLVAVVNPDEAALTALAATLNLAGSVADYCASPEVAKVVLADLQRVSKAGGLLGFETVRAVHLEPTLFAVANDLLTPTLKLKRHVAAKTYRPQIDAMYTSVGAKAAQA
ncbi:hypothetical protein SDRG_14853 [Saprolegnia diclina VS20]|uniref:AMP-dependent synthetase/ligase domain-containing protein n=1 Tax=Saprolegnia diclina (strain VS20) TaxID=1156394 RepID=T0PPF4_SAPDV|nr:hypothetical protein SDRG_14853 [Saprolegnia diclina VS20]EQC27329.1 hypothetical protein SDRG_14853 [Saprolegnia diclina VS20]|eukprot:XP_008619233.1 hypothetical protein SDRG_14853 [Saprolegnia diclina VS20]